MCIILLHIFSHCYIQWVDNNLAHIDASSYFSAPLKALRQSWMVLICSAEQPSIFAVHSLSLGKFNFLEFISCRRCRNHSANCVDRSEESLDLGCFSVRSNSSLLAIDCMAIGNSSNLFFQRELSDKSDARGTCHVFSCFCISTLVSGIIRQCISEYTMITRQNMSNSRWKPPAVLESAGNAAWHSESDLIILVFGENFKYDLIWPINSRSQLRWLWALEISVLAAIVPIDLLRTISNY